MVLKVGIIGGNGNFGLKRFEAIKHSGDSIKAICDIDFSAIKQYTDEETSFVKDYKKLTNFDLDAVVVSTPDYLKSKIINFFLNHSIHVLVEKPLSIDVNDVKNHYHLAKKNKTFLYTGYNIRFFPSVKELISRFKKNSLGKVNYIRMFYGHGGINSFLSNANWRVGEKSWGGSTIDMGSHLYNLASIFTDQPIIKFNSLRQFNYIKNIDNTCTVTFISSDIIFELTCSWSSWESTFNIHVSGDERFIEIDSLLKYVKYGQGGEKLRIGKKVDGGSPIIEELYCWSPKNNNIKGTNLVNEFDVNNEFLAKDWRFFSEKIKKNDLDMFNNKKSDLFIAEILSRINNE